MSRLCARALTKLLKVGYFQFQFVNKDTDGEIKELAHDCTAGEDGCRMQTTSI